MRKLVSLIHVAVQPTGRRLLESGFKSRLGYPCAGYFWCVICVGLEPAMERTSCKGYPAISFSCRNSPYRARAFSLLRLHYHTQTRYTPLDEWSARRRDLYLTTHNIHNGQTPMLSAWFEPAIPANGRPQAHALDRAATGISSPYEYLKLRLKTSENLQRIDW